MKTKQLFLAILCLVAFYAKAAVITVSNNPNSPGQYSNLQLAINAAASGDILYVHGSNNSYGNATISKPLTIIGAGVMPNKGMQLKTELATLTFGYNTGGTSNASNSSIYGCDVATISLAGFTDTSNVLFGINNITIKKNKINAFQPSNANYTYSNIVVENNIIGSISSFSKMYSSLFRNNFIYGTVYGTSSQLTGTGGGNTLFSNNIFTSTVSYNKWCLFSNNVFFTAMTSFTGNENNTFTKNMFFLPSTVTPNTNYNQTVFESSANSFSGNLYNQDPLFTTYNPSGVALQSYSPTYPANAPFINFNLQATSPGKNYGTDGTDVGIHGGNAPYVQGATTDSRFRYFPMPAIPQMLEMTILNSTIPQEGTLNVNFTARKAE